MMTETKQHDWVKHTITPISVLEDKQGDPIVFVDPDDQTEAEENAVYGCNNCGEPLAGNLHTECEDPRDEL